jgi:DNA-binding PucR family transcriptional regulator
MRQTRLGIDPSALLRDISSAAALDPALVDRCRRLLAPLERADAQRGSKLLATLIAYYACGGSVAQAAEALFLHRNSVRYRLDHIRALLGLDIDHPEASAVILAASAVTEAAAREATHEAQRAQ